MTILFADVVDFTPFAAQETPARVVAVLNEVFSRFDTLAERHGLEKIKTIGDAYMVVAGAPEPRADHAAVIVDMALEMLVVAAATQPTPGRPLRLRIGIASGPAVAGVIGHPEVQLRRVGRRRESRQPDGVDRSPGGDPGRGFDLAAMCADRYPFRSREVDVKGLGAMRTFLLDPASVPPEASPANA